MEQLNNKEKDYKKEYFLCIGVNTLGYLENRPYSEVMDFIDYLKELAGNMCYTSSIGKDSFLPEKEHYEKRYKQYWKED